MTVVRSLILDRLHRRIECWLAPVCVGGVFECNDNTVFDVVPFIVCRAVMTHCSDRDNQSLNTFKNQHGKLDLITQAIKNLFHSMWFLIVTFSQYFIICTYLM